MSTTTAKRGPGRPATKKAPTQKVVAKDQKLSIKREVKTNKILEYRTKSNRGAVFVMQQRGTTIFDKEEKAISGRSILPERAEYL